LNRYGSDKPDTRFDVFLHDFTDVFKSADASALREMVEAGQNRARPGRSESFLFTQGGSIDLDTFVKTARARGVAWIKIATRALRPPRW